MRTILFLAFRQLWARKGLNGIATLGVVLGVLMLIGVSGMMQGFQQKFLDNILDVSPHVTILDRQLEAETNGLAKYRGGTVVAKVSHESPPDRRLRIKRPEETMRALGSMQGVVATSGSIVGSGIVAFGAKEYPVELRGIDPERQERVTPLGRFVIKGSLRGLSVDPEGVLIGAGVAIRLRADVGDAVLVTGPRGDHLTLKVSGVFDSGIPALDNSRVYVSLKNGQSILAKPDTVGRIEVRLADAETAVGAAERFETVFGYDAESWQEQNSNFLALFKQQRAIISFVIGAILMVGGFGILSVQIMIVLQKTRDIAILRSYGFSQRDILVTFLLQGGLVAIAGGLVGDGLGHLLLRFLATLRLPQEALVKSDTFLVHDDPKMYVVGLAFSFAVGIVASLIPALRGSKIEPVDVLRGQVA